MLSDASKNVLRVILDELQFQRQRVSLLKSDLRAAEKRVDDLSGELKFWILEVQKNGEV